MEHLHNDGQPPPDGSANGHASADFTISDTPPPEDDDAAIARLAKLPILEYERCRTTEAERIDVRSAILDKLVSAARARDDHKQGRKLELPSPEPWDHPVNGAALVNDVAEFIAHHVFLPLGAADALAVWAIHTHCSNHFNHTPRVAFTSPEKRCGKTTALDVLALLVCKPLSTANITSAALFRTIELASPTLLIDEADTFMRDNEDLRGAINAGHKQGGQVVRCVGDEAEPRAFSVFAPAAIAAIGALPGTIEDRSIIVRMKRATRAERPAPLDDAARTGGERLARMAARWAADHATELHTMRPEMPPTLFNRAADNWRPLFAIAQLAGGDCPGRLAAASTTLAPDDDAEGRGARLLADIRDLFHVARDPDRLASAELCERLAAIETSPWADYRHGKPITAAQLARVLVPFGVVPSTIRTPGGGTPKGYRREAFAEAWARYLDDGNAQQPPSGPLKPQHRHNSTATADFRDVQTATTVYHVAERNSPKPALEATCGGVAVQKEGASGSWRGRLP